MGSGAVLGLGATSVPIYNSATRGEAHDRPGRECCALKHRQQKVTMHFTLASGACLQREPGGGNSPFPSTTAIKHQLQAGLHVVQSSTVANGS